MVQEKISSDSLNTSGLYPSKPDEGGGNTAITKPPSNIELVDTSKVPLPEDGFGNNEIPDEILREISPPKQTLADIVHKNLEQAVKILLEYADNNSDNSIIQKYATKLRDIISRHQLILTNIPDDNVAGQAVKNDDNTDTILIDNQDSFSNYQSSNNVLQTLLHELRHTFETDDINSKAEEMEAELTARELFTKITGIQNPNDADIQEWITSGYKLYAEASPGTYNIPQNTGFAVWYKPEQVVMNDKEKKLVIKSTPQEKMDNAVIEDYVEFSDVKDENGNPFPISAKRIIKNQSGEIISELDYGEYDYNKREFSNKHIAYTSQMKLENKKPNLKFGFV